jgi:outer membrane protein OmpA-like peptidoglycan-associated protein
MRAETVLNYIVASYNITEDKVVSVGLGEFHPLRREGGESEYDWWTRNRRVEFVLHRNFFLDEQTGQGFY